MVQGKLEFDKKFIRKEAVDDRLYSAFMEHMRDVIYNGIYNPSHSLADENGFRKDVIELVKDLNLTAIRYPGGNFICTYNWEDTVGPTEERPVRLDLAWRQTEPNTVGIAEFEQWVKAVGSELIMAVNLSTRGAVDAANLVEYCNHPGGSYYSDLRRKHGHEKPYGVKVWCVGNEVDGPWNIGMKTAKAYGRDAVEAAKAMRKVDPQIELVAVGSSGTQLDTYLEWDRKVLEKVYECCDYISLHRYLGMMEIEGEGTFDPDDTTDALELACRFERNIQDVIAVCDFVKGHKRSDKTMYISLDEYNANEAWPAEEGEDGPPGWPAPWTIGTNEPSRGLTMRTTLQFGQIMLKLLKYSDRIKIACQSILINGFGMVMCAGNEPAWVNGTYYIFQHCSRYGRGRVMEQVLVSDQYETKTFGMADALEAICVYHEDSGELDIFAVNKSGEEMNLTADFGSFHSISPIEHITVAAEHLAVRNSAQEPDNIRPVSANDIDIQGNRVSCRLSGHSWNIIRMKEDLK